MEEGDKIKDELHNQEFLQALLDGSLNYVQALKAIRNEDKKIVDFFWIYSNKIWNDQFGEMTGKKLLEQNPSAIESCLFKTLVDVVENGAPVKQEHYYNDHQLKGWYYQTVVKMDDGVVMHIEDISERKSGEVEIKEQNRRLQETQALGQIGDFYLNLIDHSLTWSHGLYSIMGVPTDKTITLEEAALLYVPEAMERMTVHIKNAIATGESFEMEAGFYKNGELRQMYMRGQPVKDTSGNIIGINGIKQDITELKKAEQEIKEQAHFINSINNIIPDVVSVVELPSRKILYTNRDTLTWLGFSPEEIGNMSFQDRITLFHPEDLTSIHAFYKRFDSLSDYEQNTVEYRIKNKNESWINLRLRGKVFKRDLTGNVTQVVFVGQDVTAQKKSEQEIIHLKDEVAQKATDLYYSIFNSIEEGFCIYEIIYDDNSDRAIDFKWVEVNPAYEKHTGLKDTVGKLASELIPGTESYWVEMYDKVVKTGEATHFENWHEATQRWYSTFSSRIGDANSKQIAVLFSDVTARKIREAQQEFLLKLSDSLRPLVDPIIIQQIAMKLIGEHLGVHRAFYGDMLDDEDTLLIGPGYANTLSPLEGYVRFSEFDSDMVDYYRRGETVVINDVVSSDIISSDFTKKAMTAIHVIASMGVPLLKEGKVKGILSIHQAHPRKWTAAEVSLVEEAAERTWAAVERAKAEKALQQSEEKYRTLFNSIDEGFHIMELIYDKNGKAIDYRYIEINHTFTKHTGLKDVVGKLGTEIAPGLENHWMEAYDKVVRTGEPLRIENYNEATGRWYSAFSFRVSEQGTQVAVIFNDITERKQQEERQAYLLKLSDALRPHSDASEIQGIASRLLGEELKTGRAFYSEINETENYIKIKRDYLGTNSTSISKVYELSAYSWVIPIYYKGEPIVVDDVYKADFIPKAFLPVMEAVQITSYCLIPLVKNNVLVGALTVSESSPRHWKEHEVNLLVETAERIWEATERGKAEDALITSEKNLKELNENLEQLVQKRTRELTRLKVNQEKEKLNAIIFAQEQERARISEGLHDEVAQLLYAAQNRLQLVTPDEAGSAELQTSINILGEAIKEIRKVSFELMPPVLRDYGLEACLKALIDRIVGDKLKLTYNVRIEQRLPEKLEITIYRIVQETLNNILKHSRATEASLNIFIEAKYLHLKVIDNGVGFTVEKSKIPSHGIGLQSIHNRVNLLNGKIKINSAPGQGTAIDLRLPVGEES